MANQYWVLKFDEEHSTLNYIEQENVNLDINILENKSQETDTVEITDVARALADIQARLAALEAKVAQ